jgi:short subunit dehydrogenase-like uncharacterized protein
LGPSARPAKGVAGRPVCQQEDIAMDATGSREFDVVVWGATGFTGRLVAEHLLRRSGEESFRWALGGRSRERLEQVREDIARETGRDTRDLPLVLGDSDDEASLASLAQRTRVVCTTVGPYAKYGSKLVAACVEAGTHYCDLTGEVQWIRRMIDRHHDDATTKGARIVFTCGFDCIPSDLGAWFIQDQAIARNGVPCSHVKYRVEDFSGGASGGTIASMLYMMEEAEHDPEVRRVMAQPYAINPKDQRTGPDAKERVSPWHDPDFGQWCAPFVMAAINTKVVRRTNALLGYPYGKDFRYDEGILTGTGPLGLAKAAGVGAGMTFGMGAMAIGPLRRAISGRLPQPGEGPDRETREAGHFDIRLLGLHPSDPSRNLAGRVTGDRDPGYGSTSKMLGESALCLALDALESPGGCSTPAAAMGGTLLARLEAHAGVQFRLE